MYPLVTIVTRTNNRPNGFKRLVNSIKKQSYPNIRHFVILDDNDSIDYVMPWRLDGDDVELYLLDKDEILSRDFGPNPNTGPKFPYNLVINEVYPDITEGYFYGIDDDDYLLSDTIIEEMVEAADEDTLLLGRFQLANGKVIPAQKDFGKQPKIGCIGGSCMFFHSKWLDYAKFDGWKCSDFRVIDRLYKTVPKTVFFDKVIMKCGNNGGQGKRSDV